MAETTHRKLESMDDSSDDPESETEKNISSPPASSLKPALSKLTFDDIWNRHTSYLWFLGMVLPAIVCSVYLLRGTDQVSVKSKWKEAYQQLRSKQENLPSQDVTLWAGIASGLQNLDKQPVEPAVYLLAYEKDSSTSCSCVVEVITTLATKLLQPGDSRRWLLLNGTEMLTSTNHDPGSLVDAITSQMGNSRIIVVTDVQNIPARLAQGFHSLVDTYGTMAKQPGAVFIFTLMVPHINDWSTVTKVVEDILLVSWKDLDRDELQPLVTRISNFVLPVSRENHVSSCPLRIDSTIEVHV